MDLTRVILEIAFVSVGLILLYFQSYMKKKAENLATKEDIGLITRNVEEVKTELALVQSRNNIILQEKVRVFKELQETINDLRDYLEARIGDYIGSDIHPNTGSLRDAVNKSLLSHTTNLHYLEQRNFIFIDDKAREALREFISVCFTHNSMEIALHDNKDDNDPIVKSAPSNYKQLMDRIEPLLRVLYKSLKK